MKVNNINRIKVNILSFFNYMTKTIFYFFIVILSTALFLYLFYFFDMFKNLKNHTYKPPLFNTYIIITNSMVPNINVDDAVLIKRVNKDKIKVGDIITFVSNDPRYSGLVITHRVVDIYTNNHGKTIFKTKGDSNKMYDLSITSYSDIYGKVLFRFPKIGTIKYLLSQSSLWIIVIIFSSLVITSYDIYRFIMFLIGKIINKNHNSDDKLEII